MSTTCGYSSRLYHSIQALLLFNVPGPFSVISVLCGYLEAGKENIDRSSSIIAALILQLWQSADIIFLLYMRPMGSGAREAFVRVSTVVFHPLVIIPHFVIIYPVVISFSSGRT